MAAPAGHPMEPGPSEHPVAGVHESTAPRAIIRGSASTSSSPGHNAPARAVRTPPMRFAARRLPNQRAAGRTLSDSPTGLAGLFKTWVRPKSPSGGGIDTLLPKSWPDLWRMMQLGSRVSHEISAPRVCLGRSCMYVAGMGWRTKWAASSCRWLAPRRAARPDHGHCTGGGFAASQQANATRRRILFACRRPGARGDARSHRRTKRPCPVGDARLP
jgi:hypothetical protein